MNRETPLLALFLLVVAVSGCAAFDGGCRGMSCEDTCSGNTRLHSGVCSSGVCSFAYETCDFGCTDGECRAEPPHLVFVDNEQGKGGFSVEITGTEITLGDEEKDERDSYDFHVKVTNRGGSEGVFSIKSASIISGTGLMHSTVGYGWSDFLYEGYVGHVTFRIADVPTSWREQNTTVVIRTNQGNYYYDSSFEN